MTARVLFRVDAGPGFGLGHLQRCLALAEALGELGAPCVFLTQPEPAVHVRIAAAGWPVEELGVPPSAGDAMDVVRVIEVARRSGADTVVVDSYVATAAGLGSLRTAGLRVVFIDDLAREVLAAHVVINGGVQAKDLPYRSSTGETLFLLGPTYALLGSGYRAIPPRRLACEVQQVLVTIGGDDAFGMLPGIVKTLDQSPRHFRLCVVVGPFGSPELFTSAGTPRCGRDVTIVRAPLSLRDLMLAADIAVSAGGQTLYELAATGTPTIAFELADNQSGQLAVFADAGVVAHAGRAGSPEFADTLSTLLGALLSSAGQRARLSEAGQRLVDGLGAARAARIVLGPA